MKTIRDFMNIISESKSSSPADELKRRVLAAALPARVSIIPLIDGSAEITSLEASKPGSGQGRQTMNAILSMADELGVTLELKPSWDEDVEGGLEPSDLENWYQRLGFELIPNRNSDEWAGEYDEYMVRRPRSVSR